MAHTGTRPEHILAAGIIYRGKVESRIANEAVIYSKDKHKKFFENWGLSKGNNYPNISDTFENCEGIKLSFGISHKRPSYVKGSELQKFS
jgi:hypothetical protein